MKVVLIPGVGFHDDLPDYTLCKVLKKELGAEVLWCNWKHNLEYPKVHLKNKLIREFLAEVIFDFQYVIKYALVTEVPEGDVYIGHSAGSILALVQSGKPSITIGSPAILVEDIQQMNPVVALSRSCPSMNIINSYDPLSYPIPLFQIKNEYENFCWWNPVKAHNGYWNNKKVCQRIVNQIKSWGI